MFTRKVRAWVVPAAGLMLAASLAVGINVGTAKPASALPVITVCLSNAPSYCADVKNSRNVSGQPVAVPTQRRRERRPLI